MPRALLSGLAGSFLHTGRRDVSHSLRPAAWNAEGLTRFVQRGALGMQVGIEVLELNDII